MDELERAESTFSGAVGSKTLWPPQIENTPQVSGKKALQEDYEFNAELSSLLNDYAVSVFGEWVPVHEAVTHEQMGTLKLLVSHKSLLDPSTMQVESKITLHFELERQRIYMVELHLESGTDMQSLAVEGVTPMHLAAAGGWILGIEMLAKSWSVPLDPRDTRLLETPLHKAARNRHVEAIGGLSALGADRKARNVDG
ncbi:hypothetical protein BDV39DRAFT_210965 [Aspergillus sergii]|uniref:Uncharacterized protein n=1 Tax=Aspergillus sergii TaxID=1034303 RepID=A0A5N6WJW4_9EURO|nr:hypothetical protein BDV39DRAFT_210965 [Aspergillus sergii]